MVASKHFAGDFGCGVFTFATRFHDLFFTFWGLPPSCDMRRKHSFSLRNGLMPMFELLWSYALFPVDSESFTSLAVFPDLSTSSPPATATPCAASVTLDTTGRS